MMTKKFRNLEAGMTYIELIVVLSIFSVLTSVVLFNYGDFQAKVDIKILANDIASKIVEAQKSAMSGKLPPLAQQAFIDPTWKPSYGLYFNSSSTDLDISTSPPVPLNKEIIYFTSFDNSKNYYNKLLPVPDLSLSVLDTIKITKNNRITELKAVGCWSELVNDLSIVFKRPDSSAFINDSSGAISSCGSSLKYVEITVSSPSSNPIEAHIIVYPSGRVQIE